MLESGYLTDINYAGEEICAIMRPLNEIAWRISMDLRDFCTQLENDAFVLQHADIFEKISELLHVLDMKFDVDAFDGCAVGAGSSSSAVCNATPRSDSVVWLGSRSIKPTPQKVVSQNGGSRLGTKVVLPVRIDLPLLLDTWVETYTQQIASLVGHSTISHEHEPVPMMTADAPDYSQLYWEIAAGSRRVSFDVSSCVLMFNVGIQIDLQPLVPRQKHILPPAVHAFGSAGLQTTLDDEEIFTCSHCLSKRCGYGRFCHECRHHICSDGNCCLACPQSRGKCFKLKNRPLPKGSARVVTRQPSAPRLVAEVDAARSVATCTSPPRGQAYICIIVCGESLFFLRNVNTATLYAELRNQLLRRIQLKSYESIRVHLPCDSAAALVAQHNLYLASTVDGPLHCSRLIGSELVSLSVATSCNMEEFHMEEID